MSWCVYPRLDATNKANPEITGITGDLVNHSKAAPRSTSDEKVAFLFSSPRTPASPRTLQVGMSNQGIPGSVHLKSDLGAIEADGDAAKSLRVQMQDLSNAQGARHNNQPGGIQLALAPTVPDTHFCASSIHLLPLLFSACRRATFS